MINGLTPFVDVVRIGDTTCGKPVGFLPQSNAGNTFSVVAFESVNQNNQGRYWDGLTATCDVADDLDLADGSTMEDRGEEPVRRSSADVLRARA